MMNNKKFHYHSDIEIDVQRIISDTTPFAIVEAYRSLYTNVLYLPIEDKCKKIVITSAFPGEGKTSVSVNLAYTIAINSPESRVLIIDGDMRSPRVNRLLQLNDIKRNGLSEYLAGIDQEPNIEDSIHDNLKILLSGAQNANSPGLIASTRMKSLMEYCNDRFDYVIIDTPPVNIVSDAILLNDYINGYIMVCRADYSDVNSLSDAMDSLTKAGATIFGTVLSSYNAKVGTVSIADTADTVVTADMPDTATVVTDTVPVTATVMAMDTATVTVHLLCLKSLKQRRPKLPTTPKRYLSDETR